MVTRPKRDLCRHAAGAAQRTWMTSPAVTGTGPSAVSTTSWPAGPIPARGAGQVRAAGQLHPDRRARSWRSGAGTPRAGRWRVASPAGAQRWYQSASSRSTAASSAVRSVAGRAEQGQRGRRQRARLGRRQVLAPGSDVDPDADHDRVAGLLGQDAGQLRPARQHVVGPLQDGIDGRGRAQRPGRRHAGQQRQPAAARRRDRRRAQQHREGQRPGRRRGGPASGPAARGRWSAARRPARCRAPRPAGAAASRSALVDPVWATTSSADHRLPGVSRAARSPASSSAVAHSE